MGDISGKLLADGTHVLNVRVYHEDTDFTGLVYHASYVRFCERGRSDFVRLSGISQKEWAEDASQGFFAVRRMTFDFLKPARYDDIVQVRTLQKEKRGASLILDQQIWRGDECLIKAEVQVALISASGKPLRLSKRF